MCVWNSRVPFGVLIYRPNCVNRRKRTYTSPLSRRWHQVKLSHVVLIYIYSRVRAVCVCAVSYARTRTHAGESTVNAIRTSTHTHTHVRTYMRHTVVAAVTRQQPEGRFLLVNSIGDDLAGFPYARTRRRRRLGPGKKHFVKLLASGNIFFFFSYLSAFIYFSHRT